MKDKSIILIGIPGVGKSTVGRLLSKRLGLDFIDLDKYISKKNSKTIQQIIDEEGEQTLLELEKQRMYEINLTDKVVAPGGSIIYHSDLMEYLKQHSILIYLDDSFENIKKRLTDISTRGIIGLKNRSLREIYNERRPLYSRYADITVNCHNKSEDQIVREILHHLSLIKCKPKR